MRRRQFYYRQVVSPADLTTALDDVEAADRLVAVDFGLGGSDDRWVLQDGPLGVRGGRVWGLDVTTLAGLSVTVPSGVAYDALGRRCSISTAVTLNLTASGLTAVGAGGTPTGGATTDPGAGNQRWVSVFLVFARALSDPRIDGLGASLQYQQAESFQLQVVLGTAAAAAAITDASRPALVPNAVLLADVRIQNVLGVLSIVEISSYNRTVGSSVGRRQDFYVREPTASALIGREATRGGAQNADFPVRGLRLQAGADTSLRSLIDGLLGVYNDHVRSDAVAHDIHPAAQIAWAAGPAWAGGGTSGTSTAANPIISAGPTAGPGGTVGGVQGQVNKIINDLALLGASPYDATARPSGINRIGGNGFAAADVPRPAAAAAAAQVLLTAKNVGDQLKDLLTWVNARVLTSGDVMFGDLNPTTTAANLNLGINAQRWGRVAAVVTDTQQLGNTTAAGAAINADVVGRPLGSTGNEFDAVLRNLSFGGVLTALGSGKVTGNLVPTATTYDLGSFSGPWSSLYAAQGNISKLLAVARATAGPANPLAALAPFVGDTETALVLQASNKKGVVEATVIDDMGHLQERLPVWREEFVYDTAVAIPTATWTTGGGGTALSILSQTGLGILELASGATAGTGAWARTNASFGLGDAITAPSRLHFVWRAYVTGGASRRIMFGLYGSLGTWALTYGSEPLNFIGFRIDSGAATWKTNIRAAGVQTDLYDTGATITNNVWTRFEIRILSSTSYDFVIAPEGASATRLVRTGITLPTSISDLRCVALAETVAAGASPTLDVDYVEVYKA